MRTVPAALTITAVIILAAACASAGPAPRRSTACDAERNARRPTRAGVTACMEAIRRDSTDAEAYNALAAGLAQFGRYEEAFDAWRTYAKWRPDDYSVHYNMGFMLELLHRFEESRSSFERALALSTGMRDAQTVAWHIGTVTWRLGGTEMALRWFREAAALDSTDASAWGRAAMMAVQLGRPAEAVSYWRRALQAEPRYFEGVNRGDRALYERAKMVAGEQPLAPVQRMHLVRVPSIPP